MEQKTDTLAQRLKLARDQRGLTQVQLADRAKMKQSDLSKLERGKAFATVAIARLSRALDVPAEWLEENEGPVPDWNLSQASQRTSRTRMTDMELVNLLRPEWKTLILAYDELLPEDQKAMTEPILKKAEEMRRHFEIGLARLGIQHNPLASTGNRLPVAPAHAGEDRRARDDEHSPERRSAKLIEDGPAAAASRTKRVK